MRFLFPIFLFTFWLACQSGSGNNTPKPSGKTGDELAHIYCSGCHLFPEPALLTKKSWEKGVLPEMAFRLGMRPLTDKIAKFSFEEMETIIQSGNYPDGPVLTAEDWEKIIRYYVENAPDSPTPPENKIPVNPKLTEFGVKSHESPTSMPMVSMIKAAPDKEGFWAVHRYQSSLNYYDQNFKIKKTVPVINAISDIAFPEDGSIWALEVGKVEPNDAKKGFLVQLDEKGTRKVLVSGLNRPVHLNMMDMNGDSTRDFLICNYGNELGHLSWYDGKTFEQHLLKNQAGARITILEDMNRDGKQDIVALFCQGREIISIFYQNERGEFEETVIQEFPPMYGSACIDVADINADGKPDLVYVNGDNADYSHELKSYHGLRIFINDGAGHFPQQYFYPVHGAGIVKTLDADLDGRTDIAVTAFFPDENQKPNEGFLLFVQKENLQFEITTFAEASTGKWLVMDTGDVNHDNYDDIVLGNYFFRPDNGNKKTNKPPDFILLHSRKH